MMSWGPNTACNCCWRLVLLLELNKFRLLRFPFGSQFSESQDYAEAKVHLKRHWTSVATREALQDQALGPNVLWLSRYICLLWTDAGILIVGNVVGYITSSILWMSSDDLVLVAGSAITVVMLRIYILDLLELL